MEDDAAAIALLDAGGSPVRYGVLLERVDALAENVRPIPGDHCTCITDFIDDTAREVAAVLASS